MYKHVLTASVILSNAKPVLQTREDMSAQPVACSGSALSGEPCVQARADSCEQGRL